MISRMVSASTAITQSAAIKVAMVPLLIRTALQAAVTISRIGRPLAMPPLVSASTVIARISTKNTANNIAWLETKRVLISASSTRLVARKSQATIR